MKLQNLFLSVLFFSTILYAKTSTISGYVTDTQTGEALTGANILVVSTSFGAATNTNGFYEIKNVPVGVYKIRASFIGYKSFTYDSIKVEENKTTKLDIKLKAEAIHVAELMVVTQPIAIQQGVTNSSKVSIRVGRMDESAYFITSPLSAHKDFNTEEYAYIEENNFHDVIKSPLSTFSIDVDAASYSNTRRFLMEGSMPPKDAVRVEEFINYFDYDYPQPITNVPFNIITEYSKCPWNKDNYLVHIGLKGKELKRDEDTRSNLTFLIELKARLDLKMNC